MTPSASRARIAQLRAAGYTVTTKTLPDGTKVILKSKTKKKTKKTTKNGRTVTAKDILGGKA